MTVQPIEYGDNGKVAREKINAMLQEVEEHIPSIWENNHWYLWETDTGVNATWPKGDDWEPWKDGEPWPQGEPWKDWEPWKDGKTPVKWVDYFTQEDIDSLNIPEKVSDLQNDAGYITDSDLPTNLSDLHNDVWFITNLVEDLVNYYKKSETYTKSEIESLIGWIVGVKFEVVQTLPQSWENGTIYLISNGGTGSNLYDEYIWLSSQSRFEKIWTTEVDLSKYFNTETQNSDSITEWNTNLFMTNTERAKLQNQSWTNTGDETQATIKSKLWKASASQDGYLSREDWIKFNNGWGGSGSWDVIWPDSANNWNVAVYDWNTGKLIKDWGRLNSIAFSWITSDMAGDNIEITGGWSSGETAIKEWVDSLNISNGVNDGLISFKTYWWTKQVSQEPILPAGYTELEYISNTSESFIDTGIKASWNLYIKTKLVNYFNGNSGGKWAFGWRNAYLNKAFWLFIDGNNWNVIFSYWNGIKTYSNYSSYPETAIVEIWNWSVKIWDITHTYTTSTFTSDYNVALFWLNNGGTFTGGVVLMGETIIDDGTTRLHLIPAKNSSWEIWMYDLESQTFFTNAGTGTLTAWPEVIVEIPEWYTILEYLQSTGTQYIKTGIRLEGSYKIESKWKIWTASWNKAIYWADNGNTFSKWELALFWNGSKLDVVAPTSNTSSEVKANPEYPENTECVSVQDSSWFTLNGTKTEWTIANDYVWNRELYIFSTNRGSATLNATQLYMYYLTIYGSNGEVLRNWIPVKDSSWVLGMYDTINKTFYTNKGTGTFTAWPSLYPSIDNPVKILTNNWALKVGYTDLPSWYTKLEYLQSTGTQYIDTGIKLDSTSVIDIKYDFVNVWFLFGSRSGTSANYSWMTNESNSGKYIVRMWNKDVYSANTQPTWTVEAHVESGNIVVNGVKVSEQTYWTNFFNGNCYLFTINNNGAPYSWEFAQTKIREFSIEWKINLIPAKRDSDGELWMYDTISQTFFTNAGTGTFTAWAEIPKTIYTDWYTETITDEIWNTATAEILLKLGDRADEQEILTGEITRKIWIKVLDGSETWTAMSNSRWYYTMMADLLNIRYTEMQLICSHFSWYVWSDNTSPMPENSIGCNKEASTGITNWNITIRPNLTDYPDIASFKAFLKAQYDAGTPVIIVYPLNSDTTEFVSGQTLSTVDGENTIRVSQSSMEWLELKMEYMLPWDSKINFANPELLLPEWWNEWDILKIVNGVPTRVSPS